MENICSTKRRTEQFIPCDVLLNIFSKIPGKSLIRLKRVCKLWCSLIDDPQLISAHLDRWSINSSGLAILRERKEPKLHILSSDEEACWSTTNNMQVKNVPNIFHMSNSCNGLLCLYDFSEHVYLLNPTTEEIVTIPSDPERESHGRQVCGFGFDDSTKQYKVIRVWKNTSYVQEYEVFNLGLNSWKPIGTIPFPVGPYESVFANKSLIYWLVNQEFRLPEYQVIVSFDLRDENFRTVPPPPGYMDPNGDYGFLSIALLQGYLCLGDARWNGNMKIWMLKDQTNYVWTKEYSIYLQVQSCFVYDMGFIVTPVCIRNGKIWIETAFGVVCYDLRRRSFREIYRAGGIFLTRALVYAETLVSPVKLISP